MFLASRIAYRGVTLIALFAVAPIAAWARPMTATEFASVQTAMTCIARNDYPGAVSRLRPIAAAGVPEAQVMLASMLQEGGHGIQRDYAEALKWYKAAAEQGNLKARLCTGVIYVKGWGTKKDYRQAAQWFVAAGDRDPDAQNNLGYLYLKGLGVPKDLSKAFQLFQRAANGGNADAKEAIGQMYYSGTTVEKDFSEARKWFQSAAQQKCAAAQYKLGVMSVNGDGAAVDEAAARKWFQMAQPGLVEQAKLGDEDAAADLKELTSSYAVYLSK